MKAGLHKVQKARKNATTNEEQLMKVCRRSKAHEGLIKVRLPYTNIRKTSEFDERLTVKLEVQ